MEVGTFVDESKYPNNWPRSGESKHYCDVKPPALAGLVQNKVLVETSIKLVFTIPPEELIDLLFVYQISIDLISKLCIRVDMEIANFLKRHFAIFFVILGLVPL